MSYDAAAQCLHVGSGRIEPVPATVWRYEVSGKTVFDVAARAMRHHPGMDRSRTLALLGEHKPVLVERFGVTRLALFGSVARGTAQPGSDIDVLVDFDGVPTARRVFGVQFYLEDLFGLDVDLVTADALRLRLRPYVERDAVDV